MALPEHSNQSNWFDTFRNSVDLRPMVLRRLIQHFPEYAGSLALRPERLVCLTFEPAAMASDFVSGAFRNVGIGPALSLRHGLNLRGYDVRTFWVGGLREGARLTNPMVDYAKYNDPQGNDIIGGRVFCEYENRFGDGYRLELPVKQQGALVTLGPETLFIRQGLRTKPTWTPAYPEPSSSG